MVVYIYSCLCITCKVRENKMYFSVFKIYVGTLYIDYNPKVALDTYIPYKAMCDAIFCKGNGLKIDIVLSYLPHVYGLFSLSVE